MTSHFDSTYKQSMIIILHFLFITFLVLGSDIILNTYLTRHAQSILNLLSQSCPISPSNNNVDKRDDDIIHNSNKSLLIISHIIKSPKVLINTLLLYGLN